ncbi:MAG: PT domain-containing protein [Desulfobacterales bacterium]|nr:PT domain-containing protein [Desulfobacterales bacterium]
MKSYLITSIIILNLIFPVTFVFAEENATETPVVTSNPITSFFDLIDYQVTDEITTEENNEEISDIQLPSFLTDLMLNTNVNLLNMNVDDVQIEAPPAVNLNSTAQGGQSFLDLIQNITGLESGQMNQDNNGNLHLMLNNFTNLFLRPTNQVHIDTESTGQPVIDFDEANNIVITDPNGNVMSFAPTPYNIDDLLRILKNQFQEARIRILESGGIIVRFRDRILAFRPDMNVSPKTSEEQVGPGLHYTPEGFAFVTYSDGSKQNMNPYPFSPHEFNNYAKEVIPGWREARVDDKGIVHVRDVADHETIYRPAYRLIIVNADNRPAILFRPNGDVVLQNRISIHDENLWVHQLFVRINPLTGQPMNQPVNKPINDPTNPPVNEPVNEPIHQPIDQPINSPINEPINEPLHQPINRP